MSSMVHMQGGMRRALLSPYPWTLKGGAVRGQIFLEMQGNGRETARVGSAAKQSKPQVRVECAALHKMGTEIISEHV